MASLALLLISPHPLPSLNTEMRWAGGWAWKSCGWEGWGWSGAHSKEWVVSIPSRASSWPDGPELYAQLCVLRWPESKHHPCIFFPSEKWALPFVNWKFPPKLGNGLRAEQPTNDIYTSLYIYIYVHILYLPWKCQLRNEILKILVTIA